jgi:hypothetical protein
MAPDSSRTMIMTAATLTSPSIPPYQQ